MTDYISKFVFNLTDKKLLTSYINVIQSTGNAKIVCEYDIQFSMHIKNIFLKNDLLRLSRDSE